MASGNLFFESDGVANDFDDTVVAEPPEKIFWDKTQNELEQLEKDFPDSLNFDNDPIPNNKDFYANGENITNLGDFDDNLGHKSHIPLDSISNASSNLSSRTGDYSAISKIDKVYKEPESIRLWKEKQQEVLKIKDQEEEVKKKEMREQAKKELEEWEKMHKEQVTKTCDNNRKQEKEFQQTNRQDIQNSSQRNVEKENIVSDKKSWEKVATYCDFNPKNSTKHLKDVSRLRSVLVKLKSGTTDSSNQLANKNADLKNPSMQNGNIYDEENDE